MLASTANAIAFYRILCDRPDQQILVKRNARKARKLLPIAYKNLRKAKNAQQKEKISHDIWRFEFLITQVEGLKTCGNLKPIDVDAFNNPNPQRRRDLQLQKEVQLALGKLRRQKPTAAVKAEMKRLYRRLGRINQRLVRPYN